MCALIIRAVQDVNRCLVDALQDGGSGIIGCEGLEGMSCTCLRDGYHRRITKSRSKSCLPVHFRCMNEPATDMASAFEHHDAVEPRHRFPAISFRGETWDLAHLDAFAIRIDPGLGFEVDVVVLFTCHCFSHSLKRDARAPLEIPDEEVFDNGHERRVLSKERYELSRRFLPHLVKDLEKRLVRYAADGASNYFTAEDLSQDPIPGKYAIFFEVERDRKRKKRLLLRIQSAYRVDALSNRLAKAGKIKFATLLRKTYRG
jgi:hypothetical protein